MARRAGGEREGSPAPRGRCGWHPGTVRTGPARAAAPQIHVHLRNRGRRARGDWTSRAVPVRRAAQQGAAMTRLGTGSPQWAMADEGWGRKAVDFATLSEPGNCREYVAMHHRLG